MDDFIEEVILDSDQIIESCRRVALEITRDYQDKFPIIIGLLKGSVLFMAEILKHIKVDLEIDFMSVSSYHNEKTTGIVSIVRDLTSQVKGRHIILVEDIIDTGLTIQEVINLLFDRGAISIEIATLLDKPLGRIIECQKPKYIGATIEPKFVVGFGLDYNQKYRNLNYIGVLKKSIYEK